MLSCTASSMLRWMIRWAFLRHGSERTSLLNVAIGPSLALFFTLVNATVPPRNTLKRQDNNLTRRAIIPTSILSSDEESNDEPAASSVICRAEGLCERCPESSIHEPFCQPYGNRRLIKCLPNTEENARLMRQHAHDDGDEGRSTYNLGETPAWEACGKVIVLERADYWEFMMCNFLLASFSLFVVLYRSKQLAALQYRRLAARIGLSSSASSAS